MALVVLPVQKPAVLEGQENGKLDSDILRSTPGLSGGPTVRLVETATRCWVAMTAAATAAGITLKTSSYADSYRTYQVQVSTFTARYQVEPTTNGYRLWDSDGNGTRERWYKKDGVASAAVPGTSNHGWAIAVDVANASGARLAWLERYAVGFGWSWELVPEEPWHLRNYSGDDIPAKVLAYEQEHSMASDLDQFIAPLGGVRENTYMAHHLTLALITGSGPSEGYWDGPGAPVANNLWSLLKRVESKLDQVLAKPPVASAPVDVEALAVALANNPVFVEAVKDACGSALEDTRGTITYGP